MAETLARAENVPPIVNQRLWNRLYSIQNFSFELLDRLEWKQCKAWVDDIAVALVRELRGVMAADDVPEGVFVTTSSYTDDARRFAAAK